MLGFPLWEVLYAAGIILYACAWLHSFLLKHPRHKAYGLATCGALVLLALLWGLRLAPAAKHAITHPRQMLQKPKPADPPADLSLISIGDGFTIINRSPQTLTQVRFGCRLELDGTSDRITLLWDAGRASIPPQSELLPSSLTTGSGAILNRQSLDSVLAGFEVSECRVLEAR